MDIIKVTPISTKAKNRFHNLMDGNGSCIVEQTHKDRLFITSMNKRNSFWIMLDNDPHWMLN